MPNSDLMAPHFRKDGKVLGGRGGGSQHASLTLWKLNTTVPTEVMSFELG